MKIKDLAQLDFSTVFFDTLFGLVFFYSLDSFLEIKNPEHFLFYLFTSIILVHWWLLFKGADDTFGTEVTDSAVDLIFGIIYIILLEYIVLTAKTDSYADAVGYLIALFSVDFVWAFLWRYVGKWQTKNKQRIKTMQTELNCMMLYDAVAILLYAGLLYSIPILTPAYFVVCFVLIYIFYVVLTFKKEIIDIRIF